MHVFALLMLATSQWWRQECLQWYGVAKSLYRNIGCEHTIHLECINRAWLECTVHTISI